MGIRVRRLTMHWELSLGYAADVGNRGRTKARGQVKMRFGLQTTLRDRVKINGVGVHSAAPSQVTLHPANVDTGVVFLRTGLPGGPERLLEARRATVTITALSTIPAAAPPAPAR